MDARGILAAQSRLGRFVLVRSKALRCRFGVLPIPLLGQNEPQGLTVPTPSPTAGVLRRFSSRTPWRCPVSALTRNTRDCCPLRTPGRTEVCVVPIFCVSFCKLVVPRWQVCAF